MLLDKSKKIYKKEEEKDDREAVFYFLCFFYMSWYLLWWVSSTPDNVRIKQPAQRCCHGVRCVIMILFHVVNLGIGNSSNQREKTMYAVVLFFRVVLSIDKEEESKLPCYIQLVLLLHDFSRAVILLTLLPERLMGNKKKEKKKE